MIIISLPLHNGSPFFDRYQIEKNSLYDNLGSPTSGPRLRSEIRDEREHITHERRDESREYGRTTGATVRPAAPVWLAWWVVRKLEVHPAWNNFGHGRPPRQVILPHV